jgi:hypothetical protein
MHVTVKPFGKLIALQLVFMILNQLEVMWLNKIEKTTQFLGYEKISGLKICEIIKQSP